MSDQMKIRSIVPYYGGKRSLAAEIVSEIGPHVAYWEPFCGSMAVLLAKPKCQQETVCDLYGEITNLAEVMRSTRLGPILYRRLRRVLAQEDTLLEASQLSEESGVAQMANAVARAYLFFVRSWLGRNGLVGSVNQTDSFCVRFSPGGGATSTRWQSAIHAIPHFRRRLRDVTILCRDAFAILPRIADEAGVAIYADPPYIEKDKGYVHDFTWPDHERLARELRRFKAARVVVSYYDHPRLVELYPGWTLRRIVRHKNLSNQGQCGTRGAKCTEVLLINGPSLRTHEDGLPYPPPPARYEETT